MTEWSVPKCQYFRSLHHSSLMFSCVPPDPSKRLPFATIVSLQHSIPCSSRSSSFLNINNRLLKRCALTRRGTKPRQTSGRQSLLRVFVKVEIVIDLEEWVADCCISRAMREGKRVIHMGTKGVLCHVQRESVRLL